MKQLNLTKGRKVLNKSMVLKQKENKFYDMLERKFDRLAQIDKSLVRKPSKEEIIRHLDTK